VVEQVTSVISLPFSPPIAESDNTKADNTLLYAGIVIVVLGIAYYVGASMMSKSKGKTR
jgi:hypothetical protein